MLCLPVYYFLLRYVSKSSKACQRYRMWEVYRRDSGTMMPSLNPAFQIDQGTFRNAISSTSRCQIRSIEFCRDVLKVLSRSMVSSFGSSPSRSRGKVGKVDAVTFMILSRTWLLLTTLGSH